MIGEMMFSGVVGRDDATNVPSHLKEHEIRPAALFQTYLDLGAQDTSGNSS